MRAQVAAQMLLLCWHWLLLLLLLCMKVKLQCHCSGQAILPWLLCSWQQLQAMCSRQLLSSHLRTTGLQHAPANASAASCSCWLADSCVATTHFAPPAALRDTLLTMAAALGLLLLLAEKVRSLLLLQPAVRQLSRHSSSRCALQSHSRVDSAAREQPTQPF
jgi:hypothetical protein